MHCVARPAARETRARLLRAGEQLFARDGVHTAQTRRIVERAGQANDSAIQYHFGSRQGLLVAILDKHVQLMECARRDELPGLGEAPVTGLVSAIVRPVAALLGTPEGRDFLRIIAQLAGHSGVLTGDVTPPLRGTALQAELDLLTRRCAGRLPEPVARERVDLMITMLTAALAERARRVEDGGRLATDDERFVDDLVAMLSAALSA